MWHKLIPTYIVFSYSKKSKTSLAVDLELSDPKLTYLSETDFENLHLYGPGAVATIISNSWPLQVVSPIQTVCFHFIVFDSISDVLGKIQAQFPNMKVSTILYGFRSYQFDDYNRFQCYKC